METEAKFKELEPWLKFEAQLKYLIHLKNVFNVLRFKPAIN